MDSVRLESTAGGVRLPIRAQPGARRNGIVGTHNGRLKIAVTQVAEKGKANDALLDILADALSLRPSQLMLISGATNREKIVLVREIEITDLSMRIASVLAE